MKTPLRVRVALVEEIMEKMEELGLDQGEAERFPRLLETYIEQNNERFIKEKPFVVYKD